ncbi:hypothetical protein [Hymenobacter sp. 102]|uniref:hypothetical protein n=1 Tax=Hymenobacter sp. 102 TaxID=3403152 RepID=UPI003CFA9D21
MLQQPAHPGGEQLRFAGAGASDDQYGAIRMFDGGTLGFVQAGQFSGKRLGSVNGAGSGVALNILKKELVKSLTSADEQERCSSCWVPLPFSIITPSNTCILFQTTKNIATHLFSIFYQQNHFTIRVFNQNTLLNFYRNLCGNTSKDAVLIEP